VGRFNLRKISVLQVRKGHQINISDRFAALGKLDDSEDKNSDIKESIKN
jgi:hypothetical protein